MIGAGQLARMTHQAAIALGQSLRVLAAAPGDPAALVAAGRPARRADGPGGAAGVRARLRGRHARPRAGAAGAPAGAGRRRASPCTPGRTRCVHAQDKLVMRRRLAELGIAGPRVRRDHARRPTSPRSSPTGPAVLKAVRGGYDGRGVWLDPTADVVAELLAAGTPLMVEERVPMRRELAALVARSPFGQAAAWPVVETVQADGQCVEVLAPAPGLVRRARRAAQELALRIADELGVTGLLAVELFEHRGRRAWSTSWRCARTTPGTGRSRARARRSSSSTCGRCSTTRSGRRRPPRPPSSWRTCWARPGRSR